jgi:Cu/Ag efflux protein CusF
MKYKPAFIDMVLICLVAVGLVYAQDLIMTPYSEETSAAAAPVVTAKPAPDENKSPDRFFEGEVIAIDTAKNTFTVQRTRTFTPKGDIKIEEIKKGDVVALVYYGENEKLIVTEVKVTKAAKSEMKMDKK